MNATCVLLRLESNWTNTCWVRLNHMWWCSLSNWGRIQFLTTIIGCICQLPKWYCFQNATPQILFPKCYTSPQILFSKFSNKSHCCLHWLLRSGKLSHRSVSVCNFLFANKSRSNLATKTIFFIRTELYFTPNKISYTMCDTYQLCWWWLWA